MEFLTLFIPLLIFLPFSLIFMAARRAAQQQEQDRAGAEPPRQASQRPYDPRWDSPARAKAPTAGRPEDMTPEDMRENADMARFVSKEGSAGTEGRSTDPKRSHCAVVHPAEEEAEESVAAVDLDAARAGVVWAEILGAPRCRR